MSLDDNSRKRKSLEAVEWVMHDSCLMGSWREALPCSKIAAFDFDGTLCGNLGNYVYPKHDDDWKWVHPIVPHVLGSLYKTGYQIIILSNQKGILDSNKNSKRRKSIFQSRIAHIIESLENETGLKIPIRILAAATDDIYRFLFLVLANFLESLGKECGRLFWRNGQIRIVIFKIVFIVVMRQEDRMSG